MYIRECGEIHHFLSMLKNTPLEARWDLRRDGCLPETLDLDLEVVTDKVLDVCFLQSSYKHFCCGCSMKAT